MQSPARFPAADHSLVDSMVAAVPPADFQVTGVVLAAVYPAEGNLPVAVSILAGVPAAADFPAAGFQVDKKVVGRPVAAAQWMVVELVSKVESTPPAVPALEE